MFRQFIDGLSPRSPSIDARPLRIGFLMGKVILKKRTNQQNAQHSTTITSRREYIHTTTL